MTVSVLLYKITCLAYLNYLVTIFHVHVHNALTLTCGELAIMYTDLVTECLQLRYQTLADKSVIFFVAPVRDEHVISHETVCVTSDK